MINKNSLFVILGCTFEFYKYNRLGNEVLRPWWNRQTRYFEGVVSLARVRSSRIGLTIFSTSERVSFLAGTFSIFKAMIILASLPFSSSKDRPNLQES